jgi:hypothetical protein
VGRTFLVSIPNEGISRRPSLAAAAAASQTCGDQLPWATTDGTHIICTAATCRWLAVAPALLAPGCHEQPARQPAACSSDPFQAAALEKFEMTSSQPSLSSFRRPTQADETHKAGTSQGLKSPAKTAAGLKILLTWMHTVRSRGKQQQQKNYPVDSQHPFPHRDVLF